MNRRAFAGLSLAAIGGVFVPQFGKWYRQGSGLLAPNPGWTMSWMEHPGDPMGFEPGQGFMPDFSAPVPGYPTPFPWRTFGSWQVDRVEISGHRAHFEPPRGRHAMNRLLTPRTTGVD